MSQPFRFVHASDFHLERPLSIAADAPEQFVSLLVESRYRAAQRVFDLALTSRADFLILAGDIVRVDRAGPRALHFLHSQFTRLAEQGVTIYWAGGRSERQSPWPDDLPLPPNVQQFPRGPAQQLVHYEDGQPLAQLVGTSTVNADGSLALDAFAKPKAAAGDARRGRAGLFTIGVAHGLLANDRVAGKTPLDYWALGGRHRRARAKVVRRGAEKPSNGAALPPAQAIYSGAPQGGSFAEQGPHGAIIAQVDEQGHAHIQFAPTDLARFRRARLALDATLSTAEVEQRLEARLETELARAPGHALLVHWIIDLVGSTRAAWAGEHGQAELLAWLQRTFGSRTPAVWSIALEVEPSHISHIAPPEMAADGTLLADFLLAIDSFDSGGSEIPWKALLPESLHGTPAGAALARAVDGATRRKILEQAATLGRELLGGEEAGQ